MSGLCQWKKIPKPFTLKDLCKIPVTSEFILICLGDYKGLDNGEYKPKH